MPLKYAPTLVIGVDDGCEMPELMKRVWFWLKEMQPQVLPIVRLVVADEKRLEDITGNPIGVEIADGLNRLLDGISEVGNLQKVRDAGFELPPNLLVRRILVAVDSQTDWQRTKAVLDTLVQILQRRGEAAVNLLVAVLTQSEGAQLPKGLDELKSWLTQNAQDIGTVQLLVLDRYRSDGSNIEPEKLPQVLTLLLLVALTPYESDEHWLFSRTFGGLKVRTAGLGIIYVPLPKIAEAAAKWLCYQLSPQALREQVDEGFLHQRWQEMQDALDEAKLWQGIFRNLSDYGIGAEVSDGSFVINMPEGLVRLDLSAVPWDKWSERIADWESKWMLMLKEFWLPMVEEGANKTQQETAQKLEQALSKCVENGIAIKATVERLMARTQQWLIDWKSKKAPRGVKTLEAELQRLDEAVRQVPNPYAIAARVFLIGTVIAYFTFVLARWGWLSGFIANWLRNFLPFVEAWMIPAIIGALGLFAILRLAWNGWKA
ncbi:MAG: hypothetical protein RMK94_03460 [Armatimonadota bacterium]|nr:hypothetical protein [Armatimonadota bacterium]